jgi:hypothetical protein
MTVDARGTVRLTCQAPYHRGREASPLGDIPNEPLRFVGNTGRLPPEPDGNVWLPCPNRHCGSWNCFERMNGDGE